jgi:hypothetical protein
MANNSSKDCYGTQRSQSSDRTRSWRDPYGCLAADGVSIGVGHGVKRVTKAQYVDECVQTSASVMASTFYFVEFLQ